MAVPALPHQMWAFWAGMLPPEPSTRHSSPSSLKRNRKPNDERAWANTSVSPLWRMPEIRDVPRARAARSSSRFVMLFEPGTGTTARTGPAAGLTQRICSVALKSFSLK